MLSLSACAAGSAGRQTVAYESVAADYSTLAAGDAAGLVAHDVAASDVPVLFYMAAPRAPVTDRVTPDLLLDPRPFPRQSLFSDWNVVRD